MDTLVIVQADHRYDLSHLAFLTRNEEFWTKAINKKYMQKEDIHLNLLAFTRVLPMRTWWSTFGLLWLSGLSSIHCFRSTILLWALFVTYIPIYRILRTIVEYLHGCLGFFLQFLRASPWTTVSGHTINGCLQMTNIVMLGNYYMFNTRVFYRNDLGLISP